MRNVLASLVVGGILLTSCGGGGGTLGSSGSGYVKIKKLEVENMYGEKNTPVINPGEEFYIKWDVDYESLSGYHIRFFAASNSNEKDSQFASTNCDFALINCSSGLKCIYYQNSSGNYMVNCTFPDEDYKDYFARPIDPYSVNYITAEALVFVQDDTGFTIDEKTDIKSVPVIFNP